MELNDDVKRRLMAAGAGALDFNAPLGAGRADAIIASLAGVAGVVVDLGCGRAELLTRFLREFSNRTAIGVDNDQTLITRLHSSPTRPSGLTLVAADVATWEPPAGGVGATLAIGVSHAFGGPVAMLDRLSEVSPRGLAFIGDSVWQAEPDVWCQDTFGELPDGATGLAAVARESGWTVRDAHLSSAEEWDEFEDGWIQGVRAVGTAEALTFADERATERERYRGVLGFAWLELTR